MSAELLYVVARLDQDTSEKMSEIQQELLQSGIVGKQTPDIPYHITLGAFSAECQQDLSQHMEQASRSVGRFELNFHHIGLFGLKVLFLAPDVNTELLGLQRLFDDGHPWTAHATLLLDEPAVVLRALPIVADRFKGLHARIDRISLYGILPTRCIYEVMLEDR